MIVTEPVSVRGSTDLRCGRSPYCYRQGKRSLCTAAGQGSSALALTRGCDQPIPYGTERDGYSIRCSDI